MRIKHEFITHGQLTLGGAADSTFLSLEVTSGTVLVVEGGNIATTTKGPQLNPAVADELAFQRHKWGPPSHEVGSWVLLMEEYVARARAAYTSHNHDEAALNHVRKVAALALSCLEQHGCPPRQGVNHG